MASITDDRAAPSIGALTSILTAFGQIADAHRCAHEFERLSRLSDRELEEMGLGRDELPEYVFSRHFG